MQQRLLELKQLISDIERRLTFLEQHRPPHNRLHSLDRRQSTVSHRLDQLENHDLSHQVPDLCTGCG